MAGATKPRQPKRPVVSDSGGWTALTPARHEAIVNQVRQGVFPVPAAVATGVTHTTLKRWLAMGEDRVDPETGDLVPTLGSRRRLSL